VAVELKKGQKIRLEKKAGASLGEIVVNLNWNRGGGAKKQGILSSLFKPKGVDLDLGCLYELSNEEKGCVQALGRAFGRFDAPPYVALDGDDRTGAVSEGENLRINGGMIPALKRILVYTFIYDGVADWREVDGVVTVKYPGSEDIIVRMDEYGASQTLCAVALFENVTNETLAVEKLARFFDDQIALDRAFNWGMRWSAGRKD
jgi:tellurite resistance protein TerA